MHNPERLESLSAPEIAGSRFYEVREAVEVMRQTLERGGLLNERPAVQFVAPPEVSESPVTQSHVAEVTDLHAYRARQSVEAAYAGEPVVMLDEHTSERDVSNYIDNLYDTGAGHDQKAA
jgi:hypothetical protein